MKAYRYENICLVPQYSDLFSRGDADTSFVLGNNQFLLPVIPANMKAVIDHDIARELSKEGYMYVMHRFGVDVTKFVDTANRESWPVVSISVGVKRPDMELIRQLSSSGSKVDYITIDIAHGYCEAMKRMIELVKEKLSDTYVIAGNVATPEAVYYLNEWGADCVKIGIGQGSPCTTKDKTGFTMPMFTCTKTCTENTDVPVIADGGIRCNGDISKALAAGATAVMAGGLFASCTDSPANSINIDGAVFKAYYGSASFENKGHNNHIEGILKKIPSSDMSYMQKLREVEQDLQSSISYAGGKNACDLRGTPYMVIS
jgi:GMP reductase